jgi:ribosomal protein S18 acetylase RimI-like enzyme
VTSPPSARGACLCGGIRYEVTLPSKWCAHCHCSMCRRAHGAAYVTFFGVDRSSFRLTDGAALLERYRSSPAATRSFCRRCGSTLSFESDRWPGEVHVTLASLLDPLDRAPQAHVFWDDRAAWTVVGDQLVRRGGASGTEPHGCDLREAVAEADARVGFAAPGDAEHLARLLRELAQIEWEEPPPPDTDRNVARAVRGHWDGHLLVAREEQRPLGLCVLVEAPALAEGTVQLVLDDIYVEPSARRRGLGSALVRAALAIARARSAAIVWLSVDPANGPARRLYERHGFVATGDVPYAWHPPGDS